MKRYDIKDRESGNLIDFFWDYEDAVGMLKHYEDTDREEGNYTENFYEIVEVETIDYYNEDFEVTCEQDLNEIVFILHYPKSNEKYVKRFRDTPFIDELLNVDYWYEDVEKKIVRKSYQETLRDYILSYILPPREDELWYMTPE